MLSVPFSAIGWMTGLACGLYNLVAVVTEVVISIELLIEVCYAINVCTAEACE